MAFATLLTGLVIFATVSAIPVSETTKETRSEDEQPSSSLQTNTEEQLVNDDSGETFTEEEGLNHINRPQLTISVSQRLNHPRSRPISKMRRTGDCIDVSSDKVATVVSVISLHFPSHQFQLSEYTKNCSSLDFDEEPERILQFSGDNGLIINERMSIGSFKLLESNPSFPVTAVFQNSNGRANHTVILTHSHCRNTFGWMKDFASSLRLSTNENGDVADYPMTLYKQPNCIKDHVFKESESFHAPDEINLVDLTLQRKRVKSIKIDFIH